MEVRGQPAAVSSFYLQLLSTFQPRLTLMSKAQGRNGERKVEGEGRGGGWEEKEGRWKSQNMQGACSRGLTTTLCHLGGGHQRPPGPVQGQVSEPRLPLWACLPDTKTWPFPNWPCGVWWLVTTSSRIYRREKGDPEQQGSSPLIITVVGGNQVAEKFGEALRVRCARLPANDLDPSPLR